MEGTRYYDLIRWGTLVETLNAHGFPDGASNIDFEKHKYFPYRWVKLIPMNCWIKTLFGIDQRKFFLV